MIRKILLVMMTIMMMPTMAWAQSGSDEILVEDLQRNANKGYSQLSGYEFEMALWAYYCINGADGIKVNYTEAVKILKKLVARKEQNVTSDQFPYVVEGYNMLGDCYENGYGVTANIDIAKKWWQLAADYGNEKAQAKLDQYGGSNLMAKGSFTETVNGVSFEMIYVEGGTFNMGAQAEDPYSDNYDPEAQERESKVHRVTLSDYYIGETEVTQELWEAVMGSNPSEYIGWNKPVHNISWNDCQIFIKKLNSITGKEYCLPTEAQWEYAARGGKYQSPYKYSGSNNIDEVAWYDESSQELGYCMVKSKAPNKLGIYDMSGNVFEWCYDWRAFEYNSAPVTNPTGPVSGKSRVIRGGCRYSEAYACRVSFRLAGSEDEVYSFYGLRIALKGKNEVGVTREKDKQSRIRSHISKTQKTFTIPGTGVSFDMVYVEGGTFNMGSNDSDAESDEKPVHRVTLSDYYIGETEVTQELWEVVMKSNPSSFKGSDKPVESVSWDDCQEFIQRLNHLTGLNFDLPTEAEWEYAARGGNKSRGYKYSGSNIVDDVAWHSENTSYSTQPVRSKMPNELGIYDMSGNVWEWCSDWRGGYSSSAQINPIGPSSGTNRVRRGGGCYHSSIRSRVTYRSLYSPNENSDNLGFRLVLR